MHESGDLAEVGESCPRRWPMARSQAGLLGGAKPRFLARVTSLLGCLFLGQIAYAASPTVVRDDRGEVIALANAPQRIVTLMPALAAGESGWM